METIYLLPALLLAAGVGCLFLAWWGRDPRHLGSAVGRLQNADRVMVWSRRARKKLPVTAFVYHYQVGGKVYKLKRDSHTSRNRLMQRVTVVYMKGLPRFGFLEKFPSAHFAIGGVLLLAYAGITLYALRG